MTLSELFETGLFATDTTIVRIVDPITAFIDQLTVGRWYEDDILRYGDRQIAGMSYRRKEDEVTVTLATDKEDLYDD